MESIETINKPPAASLRSWYSASVSDFLQSPPDLVLGRLTANCEFNLMPSQRDAWTAQIHFLQSHLSGLVGDILFEFNIPRMGRRIDVVLLLGPIVFAVEFKIGERTFDRTAIDQVWDYALDLKNFHEASHEVSIIPILIATEAKESAITTLQADVDKVYRPFCVNTAGFRNAIDLALKNVIGVGFDNQKWMRAPYHPTPTIVEAAQALYAQHSVEAIARFDAGTQNLRVTSRRIEELVDEARAQRRKRICFVTGVRRFSIRRIRLELSRLSWRSVDEHFESAESRLSQECVPSFAHTSATRDGHFRPPRRSSRSDSFS